MSEDGSNRITWIRGAFCFLVAIGGTVYSLWLKAQSLVGTDLTFFAFTSVFLFLALVIYALPRLEQFSLKDMSATLAKVEAAEKRIYAEVKTVKQLSIALCDMLMMHDLNLGRLTGPDLLGLARRWQDKQLSKVLEVIEATSEEREHLQRFRVLYDALDAALALPSGSEKTDAINSAFIAIKGQIEREL